MFEGSIVPAIVDSAIEEGALRAPCWAEIVARLAAADDLRRAMAAPGSYPVGNFDRFGARGEGPPRRSQGLVNHDALGHGKGRGGKTLPPRMARLTGDREMR